MDMKLSLSHIAQDGRPVYVANQPSADVYAKVLKKLIDNKRFEEAKEKAGAAK